MISMQKKINLTKQFSLLSFLCISILGIVAAFMLSQLFTAKIISREATVSKDFIESMVQADGAWNLFVNPRPDDIKNSKFKVFFSHLVNMPDVVRANIYRSDKSVLWSSSPELIENHFQHNEELDAALEGELIFQSGIIGDTTKEEHKFLGENIKGTRFIETYIPIWNQERNAVVGVAELYKLPRELQQSIIEGQRLIWRSALIGGLLLFSTLFWIVKRANRVMENQQKRLLEINSLSMIGETASAIAHAMRNPLASIRVCAELTLTDDIEGARESALDIIGEVDRLDRWARELVQFSATSTVTYEYLDLNEVVRTALEEYKPTLNNSSTRLHLNLAEMKLPVQAHYAPLSQVLGNLIMNAVEAMGHHGEITVTTAFDHQRNSVIVSIKDNGPGLPKEIEGQLFRPFTTKPTGTGLGLALSRHLLEHYGGTLEITSESSQGVLATICLPVSDKSL